MIRQLLPLTASPWSRWTRLSPRRGIWRTSGLVIKIERLAEGQFASRYGRCGRVGEAAPAARRGITGSIPTSDIAAGAYTTQALLAALF